MSKENIQTELNRLKEAADADKIEALFCINIQRNPDNSPFATVTLVADGPLPGQRRTLENHLSGIAHVLSEIYGKEK